MGMVGRFFLVLLLVALPPLLGLSLLFGFATTWVARLGLGTTLLLVVLLAVAWAAALTLVAGRGFGRELQLLIDLAERGTPSETDGSREVASDAHRRVSGALAERNRQLGDLATQLRAVPITEQAATVAQRIVAAIRAVTGNPTWSLVVLQAEGEERDLPPGVYGADGPEPAQIGDVHRWAAVATDSGDEAMRQAEGPWGAFVTVELGESLVRGLLLAPWEGRATPSSAERSLYMLVAQHAALALEHALLYAQARRQADEIGRMAAVQRDFLRGITHDLQTPLTSIRAVASELRADNTLGEASSADLEIIEHQADRLRRMVAQLLAASRIDAHALTPETDVFHIRPVIVRTWAALRPVAHRLRVVEGRQTFLVVGDEDRLEQVLWAILDNAIKYSRADSEVVVDTRFVAGWVTIGIMDAGGGIDTETTERAFEQFYRGPIARKLVPDGSGIGLYAARGLVRAMGGDIEMTSSPSSGTTVTIRLPAEALRDSELNGAGVSGSAGQRLDDELVTD